MPNYNKVIMIGHLTRDPQLSYTPSQTAVCDFGIANNRKWTGQDGQKKEKTCFVDCRAFGRTAENINKYFAKGKAILIEGELDFDQWEKDGIKHSKHRLNVNNFTFVESQQQNIPETAQQSNPPRPNDDLPF